jgi:transcriptional regulator with XRE-family HTH domain
MTEVQARELGRLFKRARRARKLSLRAVDQLTGVSGVSYAWLRRLESGEIKTPSLHKLTAVAVALSIPPERIDLITGGKVSGELPAIRTYFRAKYKLAPDEITQIEEVFDQIRRNRREYPDKELHD